MPVTTSFGGADAALVTAATRAGLAGAPPDYSKTFQAVATSYHEMVTSNAEVWSKVMLSTATILKEAKDRFDLPPKSSDPKDVIAGENGGWLTEALEGIKKQWDDSYGITKKVETEGKEGEEGWMITPGTEDDPVAATKKTKFNNPFSKENKELRAKLLKEKNDIYANFAHQMDAFKGIQTLVGIGDKPGGIWAAASGNYAMEGVNALGATFRDEVTALGNYVVYEKDDDGKDLKFTLYNDGTRAESYDPATNTIADPNNEGERIKIQEPGPVMRDGEKIRHNASEWLNMLTLNPQEDSAGNSLLKKSMEKDFTSIQALGFNSLTGQMDAISKNKAYGISKKYSDNPAAWHTQTWVGGIAEGEGSKSFFEEATNASGLSANLFNAANQHIDWEKISSGMTNVPGTSAGIDEADFAGSSEVARRNLLGLQAALFTPSNKYYKKGQTAKVFEGWLNGKMDNLFDLSFQSKSGGNGNGGGSGKIPDIGSIRYSGIFEGGNNQYLDKQDRSKFNTLAYKINKRDDIDKNSTIYWDDDKKSYFHKTGGVIPNKESMYESLFQKQLSEDLKNPQVETPASKFYASIKDWDGKKYKEGNGNGNGNGKSKVKVSNTKPSIRGVPYPPRAITSSTAGPSKPNIKKLTDLYSKYGVSFSKQGNDLLITGPDGETQTVEMNRYNNRNNMESQDLIQQFILNYIK